MDVRVEINWIKKELDSINDPSIIEKIKSLLLERVGEVRESRTEYITSYNRDIELSEKEIVDGELFTEDEVLELVKKWQE